MLCTPSANQTWLVKVTANTLRMALLMEKKTLYKSSAILYGDTYAHTHTYIYIDMIYIANQQYIDHTSPMCLYIYAIPIKSYMCVSIREKIYIYIYIILHFIWPTIVAFNFPCSDSLSRHVAPHLRCWRLRRPWKKNTIVFSLESTGNWRKWWKIARWTHKNGEIAR